MTGPDRLEIGPGRQRLKGDWLTMDVKPGPSVDVVHDLRDLPLPFEEGAFDLVYASHVLEHIEWTKTHAVLCELHRILSPGGRLEVHVPDFAKILHAYAAHPDEQAPEEDPWRRENPEGDLMTWVNGRLFSYGPGEENFHRATFDFGHLSRCLKRAGFSIDPETPTPRGVSHGWINLGVAGIK